MEIKGLAKHKGYYIAIAASYVAALLFLQFGVGMVIYDVMQHPAFLTDCEFFMEWLPQPGGVGAYLSLFVEQFFQLTFWGAFAVVVEIALTALLLVGLMEKIFDTEYNAKSLLWIAPLFVSVVCFNNVYFDFSLITRLLLMLAVMNLLQLLPQGSKLSGALSAVSAVAIYHFCGPAYLYSFCVSELVLVIIHKIKFVDLVWTLGVVAFYPVLMYRFVMPLGPAQIFYYPVTMRSILEQYQPVILVFFLLVPVSIVVLHLTGKHDWNQEETTAAKKQSNRFKRPSVYYAVVVALMIVFVTIAFRMLVSRGERFAALMAWKAEKEDWNYIINNAKNFEDYDRNANFFYGLATAKTGVMSSKLFEYPQMLGNMGLLVELPMAGNVCYPSSTMYYQIGQISQALHYAYESSIYYKHSPYVLRRIIDCLIISNRYDEAEIFLKQLERNMLAQRFVRSRRRFIAGLGTRLLPQEFVQDKRNYAVKGDYVMSPPFRNFEALYLANRNNQAALDYLLCYLLLDKDLENFFNVLSISNYDKNNLPKHYQEAVAIYLVTTNNPREYAKQIKISPVVLNRFREFMSITSKDGDNAYPVVKQKFADTYWIYYAYEKPASKD
ncbi:MAG: hypothetical protein J6T96_07660 [Bacteroidales bacterium]|nr:hypothetical protein [Bacteroidales bacterium]